MAPLAASYITPYMTTEHSQKSKDLFFPEGGKLEGPEKKPCAIGESQITTLLTYGPSQKSKQGHSGESRDLYAQVTHATSEVKGGERNN